jgi:hypothetical protein
MNVRARSWVLALSLCACTTTVFAQTQQQQQPSPLDPNAPLQPLGAPQPAPGPGYNRPPIPAARGVSDPNESQPYDPSQVTPDQNTLAGAAPLTLGSLQHNRNIFDPSVSYSQLAQSYPQLGGGTNVGAVSLLNGILNFDRTWSGYHLSLIYIGGESFNYAYSLNSSLTHSQFQSLSFAQDATWGRWHLLARDDFMISPGAAFTAQGFGGPGLVAQFSSLFGSPLTTLGQSFVPSETINTSVAQRIRNSVLGQAEYSLSRRSAFTVSGSYGLLHFDTPGFFSSTMVNAQAGYDYLLDPWNSFAILGSYGKIDYTGTASTTTDYGGALAYGRRITGRLAFQAAAGPEEIESHGSVLGNFRLLYVTANSSLRYERRRGGVSLTFTRGLTPGSGVFEGAIGDTVSGSVQYRFNRVWSASFTSGYALNESLTPTSAGRTSFNTWLFGASAGRQLGSHAQLNLIYGATDQRTPANCPVLICGVPGLQQTAGFTVNWHLRPMRIEQ